MIYFIQAGDTEFVKIGFCSGDPMKRLWRLQTGNHETLKLIACADGDLFEESRWHTRFAKQRVRGEWFRLDDKLRRAIRQYRVLARRYTTRGGDSPYINGMTAQEINEAYERLFGEAA